MGFYQSKIKAYSKFVKFNQKTMVENQKGIIEAREKYIQTMKEDLRLARKYHLVETRGIDETTIAIAEQELAFLKTLDVVDFYQYLINYENFTLSQILNEAGAKVNGYNEAIDKFSSPSRFFSNNKIVDGIKNRKIEKNMLKLREEKLTLDMTAESMAEWKGLIPDEQVVYIAGRYNIEGKHNFDKEGYETYKNLNFKLQHIGDGKSQEPVEKQ